MPFFPCEQCGRPIDLAIGVCPFDGHDLRSAPPSATTSVPVAGDTTPLLPLVHGPSDTEPAALPPSTEPIDLSGITSPKIDVANADLDSTGQSLAGDSEERYVGVQLGRYTIERQIGSGGWGAVYQARHEALGQLVAIKVLTGFDRMDKVSFSRLISEGRAAAQIGHPNIVKIFDDGFHARTGPYIVMEMLHGQTLEDLLKGGPIPERRACTIALQVADALAAAHANRIIHRDVKPGNIFLEKHAGGEVVKVLDFGIAKFEGLSQARTKEGSFLGTPRYMSPEQWNGKVADSRSDVYSFGVVLYQMLTGALPFPNATSIPQLAMQVQGELRPRIEELLPHLDERVVTLVYECTVADHERRARSMQEIVASLRSIVATSASTRIEPNRPHETSVVGTAPTKRRAGAALLVFGGVACAAAAGLFLHLSSARPTAPLVQGKLVVPTAAATPPPPHATNPKVDVDGPRPFVPPPISTGPRASLRSASGSSSANGRSTTKATPASTASSHNLLYSDGDSLIRR